MAKVIAITNRKGGVGKTTTTINLGIGLAMQGHRVLLVDNDSQGNLTIALGLHEALGMSSPDEIPVTLTTLMNNIIDEKPFDCTEGILTHDEGVDVIPGNLDLSVLEDQLQTVMSKETVLRECLDVYKAGYDYILIDCGPSLDNLTVNALVAADSVIIPVQSQFLPTKGLEQLLQTIGMVVKKRLNRDLTVDGILVTMSNNRTNVSRSISDKLRETYGGHIRIFDSEIPFSVRAVEASVQGESIYKYDPGCKVAAAYSEFTKEVLHIGQKIQSRRKTEHERA